MVNRKDFGIDIELPLETGGAVVGDKVTITLEVEAVSRPDAALESTPGREFDIE